jgi:hypothetical protein
VLAAPIMPYKDMFTTSDVYSFGIFLHGYWCCKQKKIKKEKCGEQLAAPCLLYLVERRLFIWLERLETEIYIFQDGGQVEI